MTNPRDAMPGDADSSPASTSAPVVRIGKYRVGKRIGAGGMGVVHEAEQDHPRRTVAIKLLHNAILSDSARDHFAEESEHLGRLQHPNIAQIIEAGTHEQSLLSIPYYAMEYIRGGEAITGYATKQCLSLRNRVRLFIQVCHAVEHAHERGIFHCDLKPSNLLVDELGRVKVIDFGIARAVDAEQPGKTLAAGTNTLLGTPQYMSPEHFSSTKHAVGALADQYSLGVVLYELMCGAAPYEIPPGDPLKAAHIIATTFPKAPRSVNGQISKDLEAVALTCLRKAPADRYESVSELRHDLERVLADTPVKARQQGPASRAAFRVKHWMSRNRAVAAALLVLLTVPLAYRGGRILDDRCGVTARFESLAVTRFPHFADAPLNNVRIVAIHDGCDFEKLASDLDVTPFEITKPKTMRALHGRLMSRLAAARTGARVLAWDFFFSSPDDYDGGFDKAFAEGVVALQSSGVPVIVGSRLWTPTMAEPEQLRPAIAAAAPVVGGMSALLSDTSPWSVHLAWKSSLQPTRGSIALLAAAAFWGLRDPTIDIDAFSVGVRSGGNHRLINPGQVSLATPDEAQRAPRIQSGDILAIYTVEIPRDAQLQRATLDYEAVQRANDEQLREWFEGKVVLVGDARPNADGPHGYPDGRRLPGFVVQAVATERLIAGTPIQMPYPMGFLGAHIYGMVVAAGIAAGLGIALAMTVGSHVKLIIFELLIATGILAVAFLAYRSFAYLHSPTTAIASFLVSSECVAAIRRLRPEPLGGA